MPEPAQDRAEQLQRQLTAVRQAQRPLPVEDQILLSRAKSEDRVRSTVTLTVVIGYVLLLASVIIAYLAADTWKPEISKEVEATGRLLHELGAPVLTLVLGYYFGSSKR